MEVLAGDIGGTKALLAVVAIDLGSPRRAAVIDSRRYESRKFPGLEAVCRAFAEETGRPLPRRAGFGVAGPVVDGRCHATNLPWVIDERHLAAQLSAERVALANDFGALGQGLPFVAQEKMTALNEGVRVAGGPIALLGAGTGLGEAVIVTTAGGGRELLSSEGGHTDFAPRTEVEIDLLRFLQRRYDHVSWERLLSGDGLVNLAEATAHREGVALPPRLAEQIARDRAQAPAVVTELARAQEPVCQKALRFFCRLYGAEAGNLALTTLSTGGVFVAGGIAPRILPELTDGTFRQAFLDKGRMRRLLESIPVHVVLDPLTPLYGAAALAAA
jgi:glucokinase